MTAPKHKRCTRCTEIKPVEEFAFRGPSGSGQRKSECKPCSAERQRQYIAALDPAVVKHRRRQSSLGISDSLEDIERLAEEQKYCCAICGRHESDSYNGLHLDHNHKTGQRRKLLCHLCNTGLGLFKDNPALLRAAAFYLEGRV